MILFNKYEKTPPKKNAYTFIKREKLVNLTADFYRPSQSYNRTFVQRNIFHVFSLNWISNNVYYDFRRFLKAEINFLCWDPMITWEFK